MEKNLKSKTSILCVSSLWSGVVPFFYEGRAAPEGMPAFYNVLINLLEQKDVEKIHFILADSLPHLEVDLPQEFRDKIVVHLFSYSRENKLLALLTFLNIVFFSCWLVYSKRISRIVGFGSISGLSAIVGKLTFIPDVRRLYGTFLINEIHYSKLYLFIRHPLEFICFVLNGKALIITNDGTKGDVVFRKIGNRNLPFYFLVNGVNDLACSDNVNSQFNLPCDYLTYIGRVNDWKRQHLLIQALNILKQRQIDFPSLLIIGSLSDYEYHSYLKQLVHDYELDDKVVFLGSLELSLVHSIMKKSILNYSLYHTSNFGNVFLEALKLGVPTIALNDTNSLSLVDESAYYELKIDDPNVIADATILLLENVELRLQISKSAVEFSTENLKSWQERVKKEIDIILC